MVYLGFLPPSSYLNLFYSYILVETIDFISL